MVVRDYRPSDTSEIQALFYNTVQQVNSRDYNPQQIEVWSSTAQQTEFWTTRLVSSFVYVAEQDGKIIGFANLEPSGHLDCFYCHHQYQGLGVGTALLSQIEQIAAATNMTRLFTEASITAQPFFQRRGFHVVRSQDVERQGVRFRQFVMEKVLAQECCHDH